MNINLEDLTDFCRAVLADNRPRFGEPWDTVAKAINAGRERAYQIGFRRGLASAGEAGTAETVKQGSVHEPATAESGDAQTPIPSSRERK